MTYARSINFSMNAFFAWSELAMKTNEMMIASAQVIQHRTGRMAVAGPAPSLHDQREFTLMGQEKLDAMAESTQAMALQMMTTNPLLGLRMFDLLIKGSTAMLSLATSTTVGQSLTRQADLVNVLAESANANSEFGNSAVNIAHRGLQPIHSRATSNAKRLTQI